MITIKVIKNKKKEIISFSVEGHADADEHGKDIVCASVSILTQTSVLALYEVADIDVIYEMDDGWLFCQLPDNISGLQRERANIILETMIIGIKGTLELYRDYIKLQYEEV